MAEFKSAFMFTLQHEDPGLSGKVTEDGGGRTRFGIAGRFHPDLPDEFFTGPAEAALAEAERIEERDYWRPMRLDEVQDQEVANKLFDMGVNMGIRQAGIYAQRAVNVLLGKSGQAPLVEDGKIGERTVAAINGIDADAFYELLSELSVAHYRHVASVNPAQAENLSGWLKRANT